jgi:large subunit ribosomal protein L2
MANRKTRPTSPGRRFGTYPVREELSGDGPNKKLTKGKTRSSGRNTDGRVTARHRGGGAKRRYRRIDFKRTKDGVPARVATIEYDPNRSANIALLNYADGEKRYILAPQGLGVGDQISSGEGADISPGNSLALARIPTGTVVHNVELVPGQGGRLGRAAGTAIQVVAKEGPMVSLRLPSSEVRMVRGECRATVGSLSNTEHQNVKIGKAGRNRHKGRGDEPRRPPSRRRRGPPHAGRAPGDPMGEADTGLPDPEEGQALRRADRPRAPSREEEVGH